MKSSPWGEDLGEGETSIEVENENFSLNPTFSRWEKESDPGPRSLNSDDSAREIKLCCIYTDADSPLNKRTG